MATIKELIEGKELPVRITSGNLYYDVILKAKETCVLKREDGEYSGWSLESYDWSLYEDQKKKTVLHEYLVRHYFDFFSPRYLENDETFKLNWPNDPIIKTGRTVDVEVEL